eukprot:5177256-Alexandrium_andersonii.AAC.1
MALLSSTASVARSPSGALRPAHPPVGGAGVAGPLRYGSSGFVPRAAGRAQRLVDAACSPPSLGDPT